MSHAPTTASRPSGAPVRLPGLPTQPLTDEQRAEALRRVQDQAEQRVRLGVQLFQAAENQTREQRRLLNQMQTEHQALREQVTEDVAKSLQAYDQWVGKIDENFTHALKQIETRIEHLQENWISTQHRIEQMLRRSEAMLEQGRQTMQRAAGHTVTPQAAADLPNAETPAPEVVITAATSSSAQPEPAPVADEETIAEPAAASESAEGRHIYSQVMAQMNSRRPA